jgi:hypothetical protein
MFILAKGGAALGGEAFIFYGNRASTKGKS